MNGLRNRKLVLLALALFGSVSSLTAENWPGWRGPGGNGVSQEKPLPLRWSATENIRWKTPLPGLGVGGPIVWDDRVFVTDSDGPQLVNLHVIALDRAGGKILWHRRLWGSAPTLHHETKSSMATPVPVTDGKHVFSFFGTGDVFCMTVEGELVWQRSLAAEYGTFENRFAHTSSPVIFGNLLILQCDHYGQSYVLAINKETGANVWKADRPGYWHSWASPLLVPSAPKKGIPPQTELVLCGSEKIEGLDPRTGKKLWTVRGMCRECIPTPVAANGLIYAVSGPKGPSLAIRPGGQGDATASHVVWSSPRGAPFVPSAIVVGENYYLVDDAGIATCLDARTGERRWQKRLPGRYTASPIAGDGKVYFWNEEGASVVISAEGSSYRELAHNKLDEPVYATPAISQGAIYVRTPKQLIVIADH